MSLSTSSKGTAAAVSAHVAEAITKSASYDPTLKDKATSVAGATGNLIESAASDIPEGKEVYVYTSGHLDHGGMSSFSLSVGYVDPEPEIKPVTDEQFAEATGE